MADSKDDKMYEVNEKLDEVRTLFYNLLDFPEDDFSPAKERAKRELKFALNGLMNFSESL
ncbi:hypothetical protein [Breznakiella homolactica]|uniref:Uncharacterized protein n=1 Tax=Breznakiella homolactica TaxID=2798577 RepID=A0A7T7XQW9_9SPIR|nr:hypothetical protein [Breznakiella homolactica]QQO10841.1 hypothetical protein JFL75_07970 [Breznakiella homolactica]